MWQNHVLYGPMLAGALAAGLASSPSSFAGEHPLVVGDSLSKEYQSEFVALYPENPEAWKARNWCEILHERRRDHFDLGSWGTYADYRVTGHAYNFAKPGGTAREARNFLIQDDDAREEVVDSSGGWPVWLAYPTWRDTFDDMLEDADTSIVFFGGNDLASGNSDPETNPRVNGNPVQVTYGTIYRNDRGEASNPDRLRRSLRENLRDIIEYQREERDFDGPMVLVAVPHIGCTPKIQSDVGVDPAQTARVTEMLDELNEDLRELADDFDLGFADVYTLTNRARTEEPFTIGGIAFSKVPDLNCGPRSLFSGDGFHPSTSLQAKVAQIVLDAFRTKYPSTHGDIPRLTDREIITEVLGLAPDLGFREWLEAEEVPAAQRGPEDDPDGDGLPNVLEYALAGRKPNVTTGEGDVGRAQLETTDDTRVLRFDYTPRFDENAYCDVTVEVSTDLKDWDAATAATSTRNADGSVTVRLAPDSAGRPTFLRLVAQVAD